MHLLTVSIDRAESTLELKMELIRSCLRQQINEPS
jgi:hypothetical protein